MLEPARAWGGHYECIEPHEVLWVAMEGEKICAVATAWLDKEGTCEIKLMGGRDYRRWLGLMDKVIGSAAREAGARKMVAIGRAGWRRIAAAYGWAQREPVGRLWLFERKL